MCSQFTYLCHRAATGRPPAKDKVTCYSYNVCLTIYLISATDAGAANKRSFMNKFSRLEQLKTKAAILLKHFNSTEPEQYNAAAERMLQLPFLQYSNTEKVLADRTFFRLKHAYMVIALEQGHENWPALREQVISEDCMYSAHCGAYLNVWFADYDEAQTHHEQNGGYLLSYRQHYYVCTEEVIKEMGLDGVAAEWKAIGYNWVQPKDKDAHAAIYKQAKANYLAKKKTQPVKRTSQRPEWLKMA